MKYLAVFLTLCILFLSSVSGMANTLHTKASASCCKQSAQKDCCKQQKHNPDNNCAKGTCNAMLSCGIYSFTIVPSVSLSPAITDLKDHAALPFAVGELSDYQDNDWNPPKA
ncbi:hypothetical protein GWR56_06685 [Mucilaginibacter sp. 14171R-50]|jgi:hypothetical protein|uniref:hypothetical protein n=1 Tax=Mucilaginibacter sp. 14171R-50 TaxID=2703789 RepID=UPI00138B87D8|nr:hypothetical protein [Mucilaginibacter sp. 14171R-50]QHS55241.1 hypothetical protein GWR56_06685 [Mucilaginibacter sp. 14171R-50]